MLMDKQQHIHIVEYYVILKKNELLFTTMWMKIINIM